MTATTASTVPIVPDITPVKYNIPIITATNTLAKLSNFPIFFFITTTKFSFKIKHSLELNNKSSLFK